MAEISNIQRARSRRPGKKADKPRPREKKIIKGYTMDYAILFLVLFLVGFGLVMIYSTSSYKASLYYSDAGYWLKRQALFAGIGIVLMLIMAKCDYHWWNKSDIFFFLYYLGTLGLLGFTMAFATVSHGSRRWLSIGSIRFQPSEVAKLSLILFLAIFISDHIRDMQTFWGPIVVFIMVLPIVGVIGVENLSTCVILMGITVVMAFITSSKKLPFVLLALMAAGGFIFLVFNASYRQDRFTAWFHPESSPAGMQTMQGLYAIGSGGLFGKGLGQSMQKMGFLPETHNDMIFSIICEELGLFGAICIILIYMFLLWRFLTIAMRAVDLYGSLIVIGAIAHIGIQVFINIGVVTNTLPNTGVPLPFISYGGTSMIFLLIEMGLVLSVSRYTV